jgi:hypothetical protein
MWASDKNGDSKRPVYRQSILFIVAVEEFNQSLRHGRELGASLEDENRFWRINH